MNHKIISGMVVILLGLIFLAQNFGYMDDVLNFSNIWPVFMVIGGLYMMFNRENKSGGE